MNVSSLHFDWVCEGKNRICPHTCPLSHNSFLQLQTSVVWSRHVDAVGSVQLLRGFIAWPLFDLVMFTITGQIKFSASCFTNVAEFSVSTRWFVSVLNLSRRKRRNLWSQAASVTKCWTCDGQMMWWIRDISEKCMREKHRENRFSWNRFSVVLRGSAPLCCGRREISNEEY